MGLTTRSDWPTHFIADHPEIAEHHRRKNNKKSAVGNGKPATDGKNAEKDAEKDGVDVDARRIYVGRYRPWEAHLRIPFVRIIKSVGMTGEIAAETEALLSEVGRAFF
jgi:hypothetical protein